MNSHVNLMCYCEKLDSRSIFSPVASTKYLSVPLSSVCQQPKKSWEVESEVVVDPIWHQILAISLRHLYWLVVAIGTLVADKTSNFFEGTKIHPSFTDTCMSCSPSN